MSCLPKPVLRGHANKRGIKGIIGAMVFAAVNGGLYYQLVSVPRKEAHANFLKTYDAEAHYQNLKKWGYYKGTDLYRS